MFGLPHSCTRRRASPGMEAPSQTSPCKLGKWIGTIFVSKMMDPPPFYLRKIKFSEENTLPLKTNL
jgi:hypothetical protein